MHSVSRELPCSRLLTCFRKSSFVVLRTGWEGTCTGLWGWDSSVTPYTDCREAANKQKRLWPFSLLCNEENCSTQNSKTTSQQFLLFIFMQVNNHSAWSKTDRSDCAADACTWDICRHASGMLGASCTACFPAKLSHLRRSHYVWGGCSVLLQSIGLFHSK